MGRNGAGKTTLMRTIIGLLRPSSGGIELDGASISGLPPHRVAQKGVAFVPQGRGIFAKLTVRENLLICTRAAGQVRAQIPSNIFDYFPVLAERLEQRGGTLSGGEQQMLAIARALMSRPRLLLLDEPSLGLAPLVVKQIFEAIRGINEREQVTVFLVEQNAHHALRLATRGYVMQTGRIILGGTGPELLANPEVRAAYLEGGRR
jgi:branched-chain amino acid transport system ATP-binding protein